MKAKSVFREGKKKKMFLTLLTTQCGVEVDLETQYNSYRNPTK